MSVDNDNSIAETDQLDPLKIRLEAAIFAAGEPLSVDRLMALFGEGQGVSAVVADGAVDENPASGLPSRSDINDALQVLQADYAGRGVELKRVGSGSRFQVVVQLGEWVARLWQEKPARYSRALLETLAIIAYRQPVTRAEIEEIRGVSVSSGIMKNLLQREWVRVAGQRDVPGRPSVYATTRRFLDHFNVASLAELPPLEEIRDIADLTPELDFSDPGSPAENIALQVHDPRPISATDGVPADDGFTDEPDPGDDPATTQ